MFQKVSEVVWDVLAGFVVFQGVSGAFWRYSKGFRGYGSGFKWRMGYVPLRLRRFQRRSRAFHIHSMGFYEVEGGSRGVSGVFQKIPLGFHIVSVAF